MPSRNKHVNRRGTGQTNPLKDDPELKTMLKKLDKVSSANAFEKWRNSFLSRFIEFLDEKGSAAAENKYWEFSDTMDNFVSIINKLSDMIDAGFISTEKCSVKARQCLQEFNRKITVTIEEVDNLVPGTMDDERRIGYTKFHMGAVLVRDGFREYARLSMAADMLERMEGQLSGVADKQILMEMKRYGDKLQSFCDVMADLGLFNAMVKCSEFVKADGDEEKLNIRVAAGNDISEELDTEEDTETSSALVCRPEAIKEIDYDSYPSSPLSQREAAPYEWKPEIDTDEPMVVSTPVSLEREPAPYALSPKKAEREPAPYALSPKKPERKPAPYSMSQPKSDNKKPAPTATARPVQSSNKIPRIPESPPTNVSKPIVGLRQHPDCRGQAIIVDGSESSEAESVSESDTENSDAEVPIQRHRDPAPYSSSPRQSGLSPKRGTKKSSPIRREHPKKEQKGNQQQSPERREREPAPYGVSQSSFSPEKSDVPKKTSRLRWNPKQYYKSNKSPSQSQPNEDSGPKEKVRPEKSQQATGSKSTKKTEDESKEKKNSLLNRMFKKAEKSKASEQPSDPAEKPLSKSSCQQNSSNAAKEKPKQEPVSQRTSRAESTKEDTPSETKPSNEEHSPEEEKKPDGEQNAQPSNGSRRKRNFGLKDFYEKAKTKMKKKMRRKQKPPKPGKSDYTPSNDDKNASESIESHSSVSESSSYETDSSQEPSESETTKSENERDAGAQDAPNVSKPKAKAAEQPVSQSNKQAKVEQKTEKPAGFVPHPEMSNPYDDSECQPDDDLSEVSESETEHTDSESSAQEDPSEHVIAATFYHDASASETVSSDIVEEPAPRKKAPKKSLLSTTSNVAPEVNQQPEAPATQPDDASVSSASSCSISAASEESATVSSDVEEETTTHAVAAPKKQVLVSESPLVSPRSNNRAVTPKTVPEKEIPSSKTTLSSSPKEAPTNKKTEEAEKALPPHRPIKPTPKPVNIELRRKCYMWYARLGQPDRATMKKKVLNLPEACNDITPEDVDELPWICNGRMCSVHEMNKLLSNNVPVPVEVDATTAAAPSSRNRKDSV